MANHTKGDVEVKGAQRGGDLLHHYDCSASVFVMTRHIDDHSTGENQNVLFAFDNLDAVGIGQGKELHGDLGDRFAAAGKAIAMVGEITLGFERGGSGFLNIKAGVKECEQFFLHRGPKHAEGVTPAQRTHCRDLSTTPSVPFDKLRVLRPPLDDNVRAKPSSECNAQKATRNANCICRGL